MDETDSFSSPGEAFLKGLSGQPEKEQAVLRVFLGSLVVVAYLAVWVGHRSSDVYATLLVVAAYVLFGIATWVAATVAVTRAPMRLLLTTFADQALIMAALAVGGTAALPMLWVVFWFLTGAGCRYGHRMLAVSCCAALIGLAGLMHWQPWWRANVTAGLGVAFSVVAMSLYLAVLVHRLERQAATDPLTGLFNRLRLEQAILRTLSAAADDAGTTAILLIDLDGFKKVNDSFGHAVGDELLRSFAKALERRMRPGDTLARLGGDEFVVLARRVHGKQDALAIADRVHAIFSDLDNVAGYPVAVSCSIGICMVPKAAGSPRSDVRTLMRAVDSAMYRAKGRGLGKTEFVDNEA
ncbi:GGDEF domain-containing protein [Paraburkholderia sp. MMS20-SJTN17]|uniref:GGDEF domain-containing protein n=1 Tax=Paraburkholderia translucens TaxID=2886945 RepID=A0ABS8KLF5_9BURK|nr:GGDEF domain-containing protein [Paraburkholderia sp. MMS20-SJTN17]MCC8405592.1 GGDEF domain-containing protein [Paraburkholderia sp. MMS20-SJTN17]